MIAAVLATISEVFSPGFRGYMWKSLGLTLLMCAAVVIAAQIALYLLADFPWPWLETVIAILAGLGIVVIFMLAIAPVTAMFAGLFLDDIAEYVERRAYPSHLPGKPLNSSRAFFVGLQFALLVVMVNLLALPFLIFGVGAVAMVIANGYLLGREYFGLVAMRHLPVHEAHALRKANAGRIFAAGLVPAGFALVPLVNLFLPLFATVYFVHIFKAIERD